MILREISDTSTFVSLFRYFLRGYNRLAQETSNIYHNSRSYRLTKRFWENIKICFRYSFLGRITGAKQTSPVVLDSSWVVQYLINFPKRWKVKIICYLRTSLSTILAKNTKVYLYFSPARVISIIVITTITINAVLTFILQRQIGLWGWLMRGLFLFGAVSGLFCKADWAMVKRSSIVLKKMRMD